MPRNQRGKSPQRKLGEVPGQRLAESRQAGQLLPVLYRSKQSISSSAYTKSTLIVDKVHSVDDSLLMTPRRTTGSSETLVVGPEMVRRLRRLGRRVDEATVERNRAIVEAHRDGLSLRDIAGLAGISYSGVDKIIRRLSRSDEITVWTTPVNHGKQTRYNFAGTVPAHSRVRLINPGDQTMFTFDNPTNAAVPIDSHTYFTEVGAELHDRYRMELVHPLEVGGVATIDATENG